MNKQIEFADFIKDNYIGFQGGWRLSQGSQNFLTTKQVLRFYNYLLRNWYWQEEPGSWMLKYSRYEIPFTIAEVYETYAP